MTFLLAFMVSWLAHGEVETRPSGAISFPEMNCICQDGKALSSGNCPQYCADKLTFGGEFLYLYLEVKKEIGQGPLKNVRGWCEKKLEPQDAVPFCLMEALDDEGMITMLPVMTFLKDNELIIDAGHLEFDRKYKVHLKEFSSGAISEQMEMIKTR